jgi:hypothetical protein
MLLVLDVFEIDKECACWTPIAAKKSYREGESGGESYYGFRMLDIEVCAPQSKQNITG